MLYIGQLAAEVNYFFLCKSITFLSVRVVSCGILTASITHFQDPRLHVNYMGSFHVCHGVCKELYPASHISNLYGTLRGAHLSSDIFADQNSVSSIRTKSLSRDSIRVIVSGVIFCRLIILWHRPCGTWYEEKL